jgi:hypothetical protein
MHQFVYDPKPVRTTGADPFAREDHVQRSTYAD